MELSVIVFCYLISQTLLAWRDFAVTEILNFYTNSLTSGVDSWQERGVMAHPALSLHKIALDTDGCVSFAVTRTSSIMHETENQSCLQLSRTETYVWIVNSPFLSAWLSGWPDWCMTAEKCKLRPRFANHCDCVSLSFIGSSFMAQSFITMTVFSSRWLKASCLAWS